MRKLYLRTSKTQHINSNVNVCLEIEYAFDLSLMTTHYFLFCLFVWVDSLRPINNLSVIKGRVFLGWTKLGLMFLLKDTTQWRRWGSNPRPFGLESNTLPLSHCAPYYFFFFCGNLKQWRMTNNCSFSNILLEKWAATCDFQQCGFLTNVDSDEPVQPPFRLRNSKWCSVSSLAIIKYLSDKQRLWSGCAPAQAGLSRC